jgi:hypothetical protein
MHGIPRVVIEHKLGIDLAEKLIKQKKEDTHQKGVRPLGRKSINYSMPDSSGH